MSPSSSTQPTDPRRVAAKLLPPSALVELARRRVRSLWLGRLAVWLAVYVTLAWCGLVLVFRGAAAVEDGYAVGRVLSLLSWSTGLLAALAVARPLVQEDGSDGILGLVASRGLRPDLLKRAYFVAAVWRIGTLVAAPALIIWLLTLALSTSSQGLLGHLLLGPGILVYSALFAVVLGGAARWVAAWVPSWSRLSFLALIAIPYLLSLLWPSIPSLPRVFTALTSAMTAMATGETWTP